MLKKHIKFRKKEPRLKCAKPYQRIKYSQKPIAYKRREEENWKDAWSTCIEKTNNMSE
jgi:hypothetical protein